MRLKTIIFVLLMPVTAEIIIACCDCLDPITKNYSNQSISIDNLDNSGEKPMVTPSNKVPKNAYGIKVSFYREIVACNKNTPPTFFLSAYALSCDCPPPLQIMPKDSITTFKISSIYDFDSSHSANSDISEYFKVYNYNSFATITDYLKRHGNYYGNSGWVLYDESELESELILLLMTAPQINTTNKFKVQITLSDGRIFHQETKEIEFI